MLKEFAFIFFFFYPIPMSDQHEPQQPQNQEPNIERLSDEEWQRIIQEKLQPLLPVIDILEQNGIPWAFSGSFTAIIDGWNIPSTDVDIVVPKGFITKINEILGEHLKTKPDNQDKFSADPPETVQEREFSSAAWGTLISQDGQEIGDLIADYGVRTAGKTTLVAGIDAKGLPLTTGYTQILGQENLVKIRHKELPVTLPGKSEPLDAKYIPFERNELKYLLAQKGNYQEYLRIIQKIRSRDSGE